MYRYLAVSALVLCAALTHVDPAFSQNPLIAIPEELKKPTSIFDGKTLEGWTPTKGDEQFWTVAGGAIVGGSPNLSEKIPHYMFLVYDRPFMDFELTLKVRLEGSEGFVNSGVQIRSSRVPDSSEMSGYQVDIGAGWWGKLYDESRRNKVIAEAADLKVVETAIDPVGWNEIRILAHGKNIETWINGVRAVDFTEADDAIEQSGLIGLQVHGNGVTCVRFKDLTIVDLQ